MYIKFFVPLERLSCMYSQLLFPPGKSKLQALKNTSSPLGRLSFMCRKLFLFPRGKAKFHVLKFTSSFLGRLSLMHSKLLIPLGSLSFMYSKLLLPPGKTKLQVLKKTSSPMFNHETCAQFLSLPSAKKIICT